MKYWWLIASNLKRHRLRTLFTLASITVAFLLFGLLAATQKAFLAGVDLAGVDRLVTIHKVSLIQLLPIGYLNRILSVDGVEAATHSTWFGGAFQDSRQDLPVFPVDPETYLDLYPEYLIPDEQREAWLANRTGMIVGRVLAERFGWAVGDVVPIRSTIWRTKDDGDTWEMRIDGIYSAKDNVGDQTAILMHYEYFNESRSRGDGLVGWYIVKVDDPERAPQIAAAIDARFENSSAETKTTTEKAFAQGFANQIGNIAAIIQAVLAAVFFTMLLVTANTMAQAVRERTGELAVLKTLGFTNVRAMWLVLAEALLITVLGGLCGLGLAYLVIEGAGDTFRQYLPVFYLPPSDVILGIGLILLFGLFAGALPARQAMRLRIADALRRG